MPKSPYDFLRHAKREVIVPKDPERPESFDLISVTTETGRYSFPDDPQMWASFDRDRRNFERRLSNMLNYGDSRGRAGVYADNTTAIHLRELAALPLWRYLIASAYDAVKDRPAGVAPENWRTIQPYLFYNLLTIAQNTHHELFGDRLGHLSCLTRISYHLAEVLPLAWRKRPEETVENRRLLRYIDDIPSLIPEALEPLTPNVPDCTGMRMGYRHYDYHSRRRVWSIDYARRRTFSRLYVSPNSPLQGLYALAWSFDVYNHHLATYKDVRTLDGRPLSEIPDGGLPADI